MCVERYAKLLGKPYEHTVCDTAGTGIFTLYRELQRLVGPGISVNIETSDDKLVFVLWDQYDWGEYSLYWLPVHIIESQTGQFRKLLMSFFHLFRKSTRMDTTNHCDDIGMILDWKRDCVGEEPDENGEEILGLVAEYEKGGGVYNLMKEIGDFKPHKDLGRALARYNPQNPLEQKLLPLMKEGMKFIGDHKPAIFQYSYDPHEDEFNDDYPVLPEQMIRMIYDHDEIMESLLEMLNEQYGNNGSIGFCATVILAPDGNELLSKDSYPAEFFNYMDRLLDVINGY